MASLISPQRLKDAGSCCVETRESEVGYWHEVDGGYARRQEILAEHVIGMGRDDAGEYPSEV